MNDLQSFATLVQALDPWRAHLVFIGGWGHRLHTMHPQADKLGYQPVFTRDTDLAFDSKVPIDGDIRTALAAHGFTEQLSGDFKPPAAHYMLGDDSKGFYAEFLTPLAGSGVKRDGMQDATIEMAGISAQKIRHLDILLLNPWTVTVGPNSGIPLPGSTELLVANPLCFMVQKLLIKESRPPAKQAQDLLYIYDTISLFGALLGDFNGVWNDVVKPFLGEKTSQKVLKACKDSFGDVNDTIRTAALIPAGRTLSPEELQATCQYAFEQITLR